MNSIYLIIELIVCSISIIYLYKKYQYNGLYTYAIIAFILSNLMSLKEIELFGFTLNLGIIPYISIFTAGNIVVQKKGMEEIKRFILTLLLTSTLAYAILFLVSKMDSSPINLWTNISYNNIWINSPRIYFANIVTMLYMLYFNSMLYYYLKKEKNKIWISNVISTIIIQFFTSIIFILLGYAITTGINQIVEMMLIRYVLSIIIGIVGTMTIYIINMIKEK